MVNLIPVAIIAIVPIALVLLLRTSGAILFFCIAASVLLQQFLDPDAARLANSLLPNTGVDYISLGVLVVPAVIAAAVFAGTVKRAHLPLNVLIALVAGLTALLTVDRFLPGGVVVDLAETNAFKLLNDYQTVIVASGMLLSIFALRPSHKEGRKKHKH